MALTKKGRNVLRELVKRYGQFEARQVLYAGIASGKFTGIEQLPKRRRIKRRPFI